MKIRIKDFDASFMKPIYQEVKTKLENLSQRTFWHISVSREGLYNHIIIISIERSFSNVSPDMKPFTTARAKADAKVTMDQINSEITKIVNNAKKKHPDLYYSGFSGFSSKSQGGGWTKYTNISVISS